MKVFFEKHGNCLKYGIYDYDLNKSYLAYIFSENEDEFEIDFDDFMKHLKVFKKMIEDVKEKNNEKK